MAAHMPYYNEIYAQISDAISNFRRIALTVKDYDEFIPLQHLVLNLITDGIINNDEWKIFYANHSIVTIEKCCQMFDYNGNIIMRSFQGGGIETTRYIIDLGYHNIEITQPLFNYNRLTKWLNTY
jgi:hypothetical protein